MSVTSEGKMRVRWSVAAVVGTVMGVMGAGESAWAQGACPAAAESEAMEARGVVLNQAGDHAGALAQFEGAFQRCGGARAQVRAAVALMALGRWVEADGRMREALARQGDAWVQANRASIEQQRAVIERHVGTLVVESGGAGEGEVRVNGVGAGVFPMREGVRVVAGEVVVAVSAAGYERVERRERVVAGEVTRVRVALVRVAGAQEGARGVEAARGSAVVVSAPRAVEATERARGSTTTRRVMAWASVGLAAVGLGVGVWATAARFDRRQQYDRECPDTLFQPGRVGECDGRYEAMRDEQPVAPQVVGFVAAGVFAVAATLLFATMPSETLERRALVCGGGPGTIGVGCEARF